MLGLPDCRVVEYLYIAKEDIAMKKQINKHMLISSILCLLPMVIGGILWNLLPDKVMRQLSRNHQGPGWDKGFIVIGLPVLLLLIQILNCFIRVKRVNPDSKKAFFWGIPTISILSFIILVVLSFLWRI